MLSPSVIDQIYQTTMLGFLIPLICNSILLLYTTTKLVFLVRRSNSLRIDQRYELNQVRIFSYIISALISRSLSESVQIYRYYSQKDGDNLVPSKFIEIVSLFIDNFPLICFISIISLFIIPWHNLYMSLEVNGSFQHKQTKTKLEKFLGALNILIYMSFCVLLGLYAIFDSAEELIIMDIIIVIALTTVTILLIKAGKNLFRRVVALLNHKGKNIRSSITFRSMFRLLALCCFIKILQELLTIYSKMNSQSGILSILTFLNIGLKDFDICLTAYVIIVYLLGEFGLFLSLILLLNICDNKSRNELSSESSVVVERSSIDSELEMVNEVVAEGFGIKCINEDDLTEALVCSIYFYI